MLQWQACKEAAGDSVLLFRMGDFYEAFHDDAVLLAREVDLTLTRRQDIPMAGIPYHTSEAYIDKLIAKGFRVAVAEQTEDPKLAKGLVKREVVRVVTPGTIINSSLLSDKVNNFFASVSRVGAIFGLAFLDLTTAEFRVIEFDQLSDLMNEIHKIRPAEFLVSPRFYEKQAALFEDLKKSYDFLVTTTEDWRYEHQNACQVLSAHFGLLSLDGFGLRGMTSGINAAGAMIQYLQDTLCLNIAHMRELHPYAISQYMSLDRTTQRNLELTESLQDGSRKNTLLGVLDKTLTPMGARLIRSWIKQPLLSSPDITLRQDAVQALFDRPDLMQLAVQQLEGVRDLERLMMRISSGYASPRDIAALRLSLEPIPTLKQLLDPLCVHSALINEAHHQLDPLPEVVHAIATALVEDPPARLTDGRIFQDGYCRELDELREISRDSKSWIARYQNQLREETNIKTLKVGFTKMFGYYIEVSKGQAERMPSTFQRRQTLVNAERFLSPELKEYETKVLSAEDRISALEAELFQNLRTEVAKYAERVLRIAQAIARLDVLYSLAKVAIQQEYVRPIVDEGSALHIVEGRHPVIECSLLGEHFVPNDTLLDDEKHRLLLITGPNMAGKSTYIRQVAHIAIMAQMGSFVPAKHAHIGILDKVFTRIGASDDLSRGQSTFMVEMTETANILNNATSQSLVILDEIGRGTSTYDGISIAWSVAEYLLTTEGKQAKTLFATHYWELTKLEDKVPGAVNFNVAVHESQDQIVFLRKIVRGGTDKSYGIHVGRLAGLPQHVITRAKEILVHLEENANRKNAFEPSAPVKRAAPSRPKVPKAKGSEFQLTFFG